MLVFYIALILYFRSRGGYEPVHLDESPDSRSPEVAVRTAATQA